MKKIIEFSDKLTINGVLIKDNTNGARTLRVIAPDERKFVITIEERMEDYWAESRLRGLLLEIIIK